MLFQLEEVSFTRTLMFVANNLVVYILLCAGDNFQSLRLEALQDFYVNIACPLAKQANIALHVVTLVYIVNQ